MTDYKDRVSGCATDIDWSKAPEGFPIWIEDLNPGKGFDCSGWYRDDGDRYTDEDGRYWTKLKEGIYRVHSPAPQWNGEGLPPVDYLKKRISYDPETGSMRWLPRHESEFNARHHYASWVSRCQGKEVGVVVRKKKKHYRKIDISGVKIYAHRAAWAIYYGKYPEKEIDHINGDSLDNSISNLREVSRQENCQNTSLLDRSTSGYCGVSWNKDAGKWRARVKINGREKYIGLFDCPKEAASRVSELRDLLGFHPNHGKPIKTPAQIAADEREAAIGRMRECFDSVSDDLCPTSNQYLETLFGALHDAGYRLTAGDDK